MKICIFVHALEMLVFVVDFFRVFIWERDPICVRFKLIESQFVRVWLNYMNDDFSNKLIYSFFAFNLLPIFFVESLQFIRTIKTISK